MIKPMNMRALDRVIDGMGAEGAMLFRTVYQMLDVTEKEVRAECEADCYESGFKDGFDRGYSSARDVIYSGGEQPSVMLGAPVGDDAALERAVAALDSAVAFYQGDSGDETTA